MVTSFIAVAEYVSRGGKNTLMTFYSDKPFVNVGVHQEVWLEVNLEFTRKMGIPVVRRDLGGGTVVITPGEHDYFIVLRNDEAPRDPKMLYERYLTPVVNVLKSYGLNASLKDQDIVVNGKKISGNGAMTYDNAVIIAGNILLSLDINLISNCIKVPSEKFRDKMAKEMSEWLTSFEKELGYIPPRDEINEKLKEEFERSLNIKFEDSNLTPEEIEVWEKLAREKMKEEWIFYKDLRHPDLRTERCVKISSTVAICHIDYKARKLIRITLKIVNRKIDEVSISGDFFIMNPKNFLEELEDKLRGIEVKEERIREVIKNLFELRRPIIFGFTSEDLINAFKEILNKPEVQEVL
jgi:lipoate-protein ligase A